MTARVRRDLGGPALLLAARLLHGRDGRPLGARLPALCPASHAVPASRSHRPRPPHNGRDRDHRARGEKHGT